MDVRGSEIAIIGGGICGLALALNLHERGILCRVYERAPEFKELGVGITLLPHAIRELAALGLQSEIEGGGIENRESCFFNRFGQLIYKEPRGRYAGYAFPEIGTHRARLHLALYKAAVEKLGADRIQLDHECVGTATDGEHAILQFAKSQSGDTREPVRASAAVACDGVNSAVRRQFYRDEQLAFAGINTWRGVTVRPPILDGRTYFRIGSILTGKIVIYPIADNIDGRGNQLINWTTEITQSEYERNDWNQPGKIEDFIDVYESWRFEWLDVPELIRRSEFILEYPMVDKDPVERWTFGRVTFAGDAAHPMYPRGSNGAAQAIIDARVLAESLASAPDIPTAFSAYEAKRRPATARVVLANRSNPPDVINIKVEQLVGDRPFENLDDYISQEELRALSEEYKRTAGFSPEQR